MHHKYANIENVTASTTAADATPAIAPFEKLLELGATTTTAKQAGIQYSVSQHDLMNSIGTKSIKL